MRKSDNSSNDRSGWKKFLRKHALTLTLLSLIGIIYYALSIKWHAGPASGIELNIPQDYSAAPAAQTIKVATFNIHSAKGMDGQRDIGRIAKLLTDVEIAGLNEVSRSGFLGHDNQAQLLGEALNIPWLFAPTEIRWAREDFGNAVLCSLPVQSWIRIPIKTKPNVAKRNFLLLRVSHPNGPINVLITHISNDHDDHSHVRSMVDLFLSLETPAILMGDMNNYTYCQALKELLALPDVDNAIKRTEQEYLDWIIVRGLDIIDSKVVPRHASDHPTLYAELAWPKSPDGKTKIAELR